MSSEIFSHVQRSAAKMGSCDPVWLVKRTEPTFTVQRAGNSGPPMVLLHGLFGALSNWNDVTPLFAKYCRTYALEFPIISGHRSEVKIKALAAYTEYFIRKEGLGKVILCGNSLGGHVAMRLYLACPELVDSIVLSGSSGLYEHSVDALPIRPDARFVREHMSRVFYHQRFITDAAVNEIADIIKHKSHVLNLIHCARSAKKDNLHDVLPTIAAPTLLLWGLQDKVTTMDVAETFNKQIPNSELKTIDGCGHAPMIEHPQWFADEVEKFLRAKSGLKLP